MSAQVDVQRFRLTVNRYHQMIAAGIFGPEDKVELIEGELIAMAPTKPEHAHLVSCLIRLLTLSTSFGIRGQSPITLPEHSEPEPDIVVVTPKNYLKHHPTPKDVMLLIEVADSSLCKDKQIKLPLYERYQIPEVWIVDVTARAIECYWEATAGQYAKTSRMTAGTVKSPTQPEIQVRVADLWYED
jgi:Uma2 family endonuclease